MAKTRLKAGFVSCSDDGNVVMVGFADQQHDTKAYILLQRSLHPTAQDRAAGEDDVYIEMDDQLHSAYGGIRSIVLSGDRLTVCLGDKTAALLRAQDILEVELSGAQGNRAQLADMLARLCSGYVQVSTLP